MQCQKFSIIAGIIIAKIELFAQIKKIELMVMFQDKKRKRKYGNEEYIPPNKTRSTLICFTGFHQSDVAICQNIYRLAVLLTNLFGFYNISKLRGPNNKSSTLIYNVARWTDKNIRYW